MPEKDLTDSDGNHFKVLDVDGYYLPNFGFANQEKDFRRMADHWQARDDDVYLCNYTKSGTHWIWEIIQMLYQQKAELLNCTKEEWMLECMNQQQFDSMASPRILNSHIYFSMLPRDAIRRRCKIIYTIRNPKDVAVSYYHHHRNILIYEFEGKWNSYFDRFLRGDVDYMSWFDNVRHWYKAMEENKDYPFHVIHYENMHTNCAVEIKQLANFLNVTWNEKLIQDICDKCSIEVMRKEKKQNHEHWRNNQGLMYRQGKVGGWKDVFTVEQNEKFDKIYALKMADIKLNPRYNL